MASYKNIEEYRRKKKLHRVGGRVLALLILCAVLCLVLFGVQYVRENSLTDKITGGLTAEEQKFPLTIKKEQLMDLVPLGDGFAVLSKSNVLTYAHTGKREQTIPHGCTNPVIKGNGRFLLTYDRGGTRFRVDSAGGKVGEMTADGTILTAALSSGGSVAVVMAYHQSSFPVIVVYDNGMRATYRNLISEDFISAAFSGDGSHLLTLGVKTTNGLLSAALFDFDLTQTSEPVVTEVIDILPLQAVYTRNGMRLVGGDGLVSIHNGEQTRWKAKGDLQHLSLAPDGTAFVVSGNLFSSYSTLTAVAPDGTVTGTVEFEDEILDVSTDGRRVLVLGKRALYPYDMKLTPQEKIVLDRSCVKVAQNGDFAYVMSEDGVNQARLD